MTEATIAEPTNASNARPDLTAFARVPGELVARPQWVCWRLVERYGKLTKIPYTPAGRAADTTDPETWADYAAALEAYAARPQFFSGIGFVFAADDPYAGVDLDDCIDPETGELAEWADRIIRKFNTYTEISPSGAGVKMWMRAGLLPPTDEGGRRRTGSVEMYTDDRYFTVTGRHLDDTPRTIEARDAEFKAFYAAIFTPEPAPAGNIEEVLGPGPWSAAAKPAGPSDTEVIDKVREDTKYAALWKGDASAYDNDESRADLALMGRVGFFVGWEAGRMESIFGQSALAARDKWTKRADYRKRTIDEARGGKTNAYDWTRRNGHAHATIPPETDGQETESECPRDFEMTDVGNGQRLIKRHGRKLRHCPKFNRWLVWTGRQNQADETGAVDRMAVETIHWMKVTAAATDDKIAAAKLFKHALNSESNRKVKDMIERASKEAGVFISPEELDRDPWLLNVENGTLNLKTGELQPHRQSDLITKLAPVRYDPAATCPVLLAFLDRIFAGNGALIGFVRRVIGYTLTGATSERCLFILWGSGANGKSTLLAVMRHVLGDYAIQMPAGALMAKKHEGIPNEIARLKGARYVSAVETDEGRRLAEALIKQLTGGEDQISARFMRAEWFDFKPEFKLFVATNHKPEIRGTDDGIWDRVKLIPFNVRIPKDERDQQLAEKLKAEAPGILAWAVQGCLEWQREGFHAPQEVRAATTVYRQEMDRLGEFIAEQCVTGPDLIAQATPLYEVYKVWCQLRGEAAMNQTRFGRQLDEKGYRSDRDSTTGRSLRRGIGIRVSESPEGF